MRFDLTDLRLFLTVAEQGSFTCRAAAMNLAFASVSHRVAGMEAVNNEDLTAAEDSSAIAFAFYHKPPNSGFKHIDVPSLGTWVSYGVMVDGGGPTGNGPVPPWSPYLRQIAAGMAIAEAAEMIDPKLKSSALDLAAKQVGLAAQGMQKQMQAEAKGH